MLPNDPSNALFYLFKFEWNSIFLFGWFSYTILPQKIQDDRYSRQCCQRSTRFLQCLCHIKRENPNNAISLTSCSCFVSSTKFIAEPSWYQITFSRVTSSSDSKYEFSSFLSCCKAFSSFLFFFTPLSSTLHLYHDLP